MEVVSSLLNTAMERVLGVLIPDPNGACALLPTLVDELDELKHLKSTDSLDFPGSTMPCTPPERCIWMKKIYKDLPIGQIVWPGTHKSATNKIGINFLTRPFGQHQTLSIYYQLRNGVRVLDIRVQQDGRVCYGNFLSYSMADVIKDVNKFMSETQYEIIILEIQTERGYTDPPNFESYLVHELGDLLIKQDDHVFSKTISQVLPRRIICIWKPKNSPRPSVGGPIWSASYLRGDEFETELPLTKFRANLINLSQQIPASERNYFYKVEHILMPQANSAMEWMLVWPRHAKVVSKRINEFARLFLANCKSQDILDRLQIYSTDFIDDDFIVACISLNYSMDIKEYKEHMEMMMQKHRQDLEELKKKFEDEKLLKAQQIARTHATQIYELHEQQNKNALDKEHLEMVMQKLKQDLEEKVKNLEVQLETTKLKSIENMRQAVSEEKNRATQIQGDLEELRKKFEDEKVRMEAIKNSILIEKEKLMGELAVARKQLEIMQKGSQDPKLPVTVAPMPCEFQLINGDGRFNVNGLRKFVEKVNFGECGVEYVILSIVGCQSTGKSSLLNHLFNTSFEMMGDSYERSKTTKGIWMARCASREQHTLIMNMESSYGEERGPIETAFLKQRALFCLALSDIVLINLWYNDFGREDDLCILVLRNVFTEIITLSKSKSRRVTLMFVIRDTPPEAKFKALERRLKKEMNVIWDSILKPESHQNTTISEFCNVQVVAISSYIFKDAFIEEVDMLRQRLDHLLTSVELAGDRGDVVPASAFAVSAEGLWRTIKENGGKLSNFDFSPSCILKIQKGDISQWFVDGSSDAIVNSANEQMLGGGGADGAIHRAAGPELRKACYKFPEIRNGVRCPTGQAKITPGFKLPCSRVIHTVGPMYGDDENPQSSLTNAYRNSFRVAKENNIKYIAFPAISCGMYGYPYEEAATIALSSAREFSKDFKEIHFVLFMDDIYSIWMKRASELRLTTSICASQ